MDAGSGFLAYDWSTGATTQTVTVSDAGVYFVDVTDTNGCTGRDTIVIGLVPVSVQELGANAQVSLFPNPADDRINIRITGIDPGVLRLRLLDITGQMVADQPLQVGGPTVSELDVSRLPAGMYLFILENDQGRLVRKLTIQ